MRLTQHTDYAIRVLLYAATLWPGGRLASIQDIARDYGISKNHLMKVVHRLAQRGFLSTRRGRHGGLALAADPARTRLGDVVRAVEDDVAIVECLDGPSDCPLAGACHAAAALERARSAFFAELDRTTLADLVPGHAASSRQVIAFPASLRSRQGR